MKKIVIYGVGDFAKTLSSYIEEGGQYKIVAYIVDAQYLPKNSTAFNGKPLLSVEAFLSNEQYKSYCILLAVGYSNMRARKLMFNKAIETGREIVNFVSNKAIIHKSVQLGIGNIIFPNTVIEPNVKIGNNNIFWSSVNISHDVKIGSHSFFASQSLLGGFCVVNDNCFVGFKGTVLQGVTLDIETLVGACSLVIENTEPHGRYVGSPATLSSIHCEKGISIK